MDISPSHTNNTNNLEEEIKEEGDFDVVNMDISPSHTICIKNLNEEFNGEDGQTNKQEKKKKKRKRGGRLNRLRRSCQRMGRLSRKGKKLRAMLQLQLQNNDSDPLAGSSTLSDMSHCTVARVPLIKQEPIEDSVSDEDEEFEVNCEVELGSCELSKVDGKEIRVKKETVEEPLRSDVNGLTPLHVCAQENQVSVAAVLVQNGANVNAVSKAGYTPLHVACYYGNTDMVQFLLENGASVNAGVTRQNMAELEGTLFEENCSEFKFISIPYKCAKAGHQKARLQ